MDYLALTLPGGKMIDAPASVPTGGTDVLAKVIGNAINIMLIIAVFAALVFLILGGIQWIRSGGDKSQIASARSKITMAIVGLAIALFAFLIVNLFGVFFNVKLFGR